MEVSGQLHAIYRDHSINADMDMKLNTFLTLAVDRGE